MTNFSIINKLKYRSFPLDFWLSKHCQHGSLISNFMELCKDQKKLEGLKLQNIINIVLLELKFVTFKKHC